MEGTERLVARLQRLKKSCKDAELAVSRLEGQRDQIIQQFKKDFGCSDMEEVREKIQSLEKDIATRSARVEKMLNELEEKARG